MCKTRARWVILSSLQVAATTFLCEAIRTPDWSVLRIAFSTAVIWACVWVCVCVCVCVSVCVWVCVYVRANVSKSVRRSESYYSSNITSGCNQLGLAWQQCHIVMATEGTVVYSRQTVDSGILKAKYLQCHSRYAVIAVYGGVTLDKLSSWTAIKSEKWIRSNSASSGGKFLVSIPCNNDIPLGVLLARINNTKSIRRLDSDREHICFPTMLHEQCQGHTLFASQ